MTSNIVLSPHGNFDYCCIASRIGKSMTPQAHVVANITNTVGAVTCPTR